MIPRAFAATAAATAACSTAALAAAVAVHNAADMPAFTKFIPLVGVGIPHRLRFDAVDDRVMGGISASRMRALPASKDVACTFEGHLTSESNGGFCSVRAEVPSELRTAYAGCDAYSITVRGDGRTYRLGARHNDDEGLNYVLEFPTRTGEVTHNLVRLQDMRAQWRGRRLRDAPLLTDVSQVAFVGVSVVKTNEAGTDQCGDFSLDVLQLSAVATR